MSCDAPTPATPAAPDPFDLTRLRLPETEPDYGVREHIAHVPFRKPSKETFFRVRPGAEYRAVGGVVELKEDESETYWVDPALWPALADEPCFGRRQLVTCVTRAGALFIWGCRLPGPDGK